MKAPVYSLHARHVVGLMLWGDRVVVWQPQMNVLVIADKDKLTRMGKDAEL